MASHFFLKPALDLKISAAITFGSVEIAPSTKASFFCFIINVRMNTGFQLVSKKDLGVSKNRGTPKWMVSDGKPY